MPKPLVTTIFACMGICMFSAAFDGSDAGPLCFGAIMMTFTHRICGEFKE